FARKRKHTLWRRSVFKVKRRLNCGCLNEERSATAAERSSMGKSWCLGDKRRPPSRKRQGRPPTVAEAGNITRKPPATARSAPGLEAVLRGSVVPGSLFQEGTQRHGKLAPGKEYFSLAKFLRSAQEMISDRARAK